MGPEYLKNTHKDRILAGINDWPPWTKWSVAGQERMARRLCEAARDGNIAVVEQMEGSVNQGDWDGRTALHWAAASGYPEVIEALLSRGALLHARDTHQYTPLHLAAIHGQFQAVRMLLTMGANPNLKDKWRAKPVGVVCMGCECREKANSIKRWLLREAHSMPEDFEGQPPDLVALAHMRQSEKLRQQPAAVKPASPAAEPPVAVERSLPDADDRTAVAPSSPVVAVEGSSEGKRSVQSPTRKPTVKESEVAFLRRLATPKSRPTSRPSNGSRPGTPATPASPSHTDQMHRRPPSSDASHRPRKGD